MKMNHYATLAYDHARQHRPKAFAAMADPIAHFSRLGEEVENRIMTMRDQLLATPSSPETFEDYRRRAYQARRQAEEMVLAEMVWTEPEPTTHPEDDQVLAYRSRLAMTAATLASVDRDWNGAPAEMPHQT